MRSPQHLQRKRWAKGGSGYTGFAHGPPQRFSDTVSPRHHKGLASSLEVPSQTTERSRNDPRADRSRGPVRSPRHSTQDCVEAPTGAACGATPWAGGAPSCCLLSPSPVPRSTLPGKGRACTASVRRSERSSSSSPRPRRSSSRRRRARPAPPSRVSSTRSSRTWTPRCPRARTSSSTPTVAGSSATRSRPRSAGGASPTS